MWLLDFAGGMFVTNGLASICSHMYNFVVFMALDQWSFSPWQGCGQEAWSKVSDGRGRRYPDVCNSS